MGTNILKSKEGVMIESAYNKPFIELVGKTRAEQEEDFRQIAAYADPDCKYCYGTAKEAWLVDLDQYKVCECVLENIRILRERGIN